MKYLMALSEEVKAIRTPSFGNLAWSAVRIPMLSGTRQAHSGCVEGGSNKIQACHLCHPIKSHTSKLSLPSMKQYTVDDEYDTGQTKPGIEGSPVGSELGTAET